MNHGSENCYSLVKKYIIEIEACYEGGVKMEVFTLIGESGTGKSSNAITIAHEHDIPAIIDDGLLIHNGEKITGSSAKFEKTTIAAVKRAIFHDEEHAENVKQALKELEIERILVIGTSKRMVERIVERLEIGPIDHQFYIEDILTPEQIEKNKNERMTKGKHIIPVSYKQFDQNFIQKLIQKGIEIFSPQKEKVGEITVVKPYFHRRLLVRLKQEKQLKKRIEESRPAVIYVSTKEEIAKLIPVIINYVEEQLLILKNNIIQYYESLSEALYDKIMDLLAYLRYIVRFLIEQVELRYSF